MSSTQESNESLNGKVPSQPQSPRDPIALDPPFFEEFELPDNIPDSAATESTFDSGIPRFEEFRHPNVKLFVTIWAVFSLLVIIFQAAWRLPYEFRGFICMLTDENEIDEGCSTEPKISLHDIFHFLIRLYFEFSCPVTILFVIIFFHVAISFFPRFALQVKFPITGIVPGIYITCFFYTITNFLSAIAMLPSISTTSRTSVWVEYLITSGMGLFWMYSLLNMFSFSQLTTFNFIRAREKYQMRQVENAP